MDLSSGAFIGGNWLPAARNNSFTSTNPATNEVLGYASECGETEARAAINAATDVFHSDWAQSPRLRQNILLSWADRLTAAKDSLARLLTLENGKPLQHSYAEVAGSISQIRYYAGLARHIPGHVLEVAPGEFSTILREPAGVVGIITPWNAPVALLIRSLAPALAAGCTCVVKPAPQTVLITAAVLRELGAVEGLPAGAINMVTESNNICARFLVTSDAVDVLSFTGSTEVGQKIMAAAAPTMKKLSLELGGKAACLVFPDVDIEQTAAALARAGTILCGQQCTAARRILVHESCAAAMKATLKRELSNMRIGHGLEPDSQIGPIIDHPTRDRIHAQVEQALSICDEVLLEGGVPTEPHLARGAFLKPTLIAHTESEVFFCQEEIFGPLMVLETFSSEAEAVSLANNTPFGLAASVWSNNGAQSMRVARALRNGTVWLNEHGRFSAEAETGGYRKSGLGRLQGYDALNDFTELKHIFQSVSTIT